ncbi:MAG: hypothetical protein WC565_05635 [Parcubacteria group bacterium]
MSETWHAERMYIVTENGTFVGQAFSLDDATAIVREHNAHDALLVAAKVAYQGWRDGGDVWGAMQQLKAAIAQVEGKPS